MGEYSYLVSLKDTSYEVHLDQLKPYVAKFWKVSPQNLCIGWVDTKIWKLKRVNMRWNAFCVKGMEKMGRFEFLTRWEGYEPGSETWEPVSHFVMKYCVKLVQYLRKNGLRVDLGASLRDVPSP